MPEHFHWPEHPFRVDPGQSFDLERRPHRNPDESRSKSDLKHRLSRLAKEIDDSQRMLYANSSRALLVVFQAMDAAGKDSTIRAVFRRVDPNGLDATSFKQPSKLELSHDFLWRTTLALPPKGHIGVFNRSQYEEVLVVRVHPEYLGAQDLPSGGSDLPALWQRRYQSINDQERHLVNSGTTVIKFFLNVSRKEQARRFLSRLDSPEKRFKFSMADLRESQHWDKYMTAYQEMLAATSTGHAPWYVIPADSKPAMRVEVAEIVASTLANIHNDYPSPDRIDDINAIRQQLLETIGR